MKQLNDCVLVVEDECMIADCFVDEIEAMGRTVCGVADTAERAIMLACEHRPALVLMDVRLKCDEDGVDAALAIHKAVGSKIIFITGSREPANLKRIALDHPTAVLFKPLGRNQLRRAVEAAMSPSEI
jgi:CheY-like chemotaxis protein